MSKVVTTQRVYIAGQMSGLKDMNFPMFDAAKEVLIARGGFDVTSPADMDREAGYDGTQDSPEGFREEALRKDVKVLCEMDAIAFLPGWMNSAGARLEALMAVETGLHLYLFTADLSLVQTCSKSYVLEGVRNGIDKTLGR
jgi:hypothetical protein